MNQLNALHGDEAKDPPREWNSQPPAAHFKSWTSHSRTNPVVSAIMEILNNHATNNDDVEVHPSDFPFEYNYESVPDTDNTPIKSIDDNEMDHLLELFHS